ncbi:MAG: tripartite tricarboxylate transporter substrate-binding protein, partial [Phycisphaerales bacterium]|nr:tripartite tricarboxylate transporter substrate-binding protein [Phycisphaerales bacterium]
IIVDNRPGGALQLGLELTAKSPPDGYTIGYAMIGALAISPNMLSKPPIDVQKDLAPISQTTTGQMMLVVGPSTPFKSVRDVIAFAKENPNKLNYASSGNGTPGHVGFELFKTMTGTQAVHVPYKGGAPALTELVAGQVQIMLESTNSIMPHAKGGRVRGLAVSGPKRAEAMPELPTIAEAGVPGFEVAVTHGVCATARTPPALVTRLNREIVAAINAPEVRERLTAIGAEIVGNSSAEYQAATRAEIPRWEKVVREIAAKGR